MTGQAAIHHTDVETNALGCLLADTSWAGCEVQWFPADWSPRTYGCVQSANGQTAVILKSPPDDSPLSMIGHQLGAWYKMNLHFRDLGLNVPEIYKADLTHGFVLMEDFGTQTIAIDNEAGYLMATDILVTMRDHPNALKGELIKYENTHVYNALSFFPKFILDSESLANQWFQIWQDIEKSLPPCPRALTHIDFQAANLMWMENNTQQIGIIDFQAACDGPFVYDMVNLLEDIRRDIPQKTKEKCINRYCATLSPDDRHAFDAWYIVITAQFHARILGQILKLAKENGRDDLMKFYAPLTDKFMIEINHPKLTPLKTFINENGYNT